MWENRWWEQIATEAEEGEQNNDPGATARALKKLDKREDGRRKGGTNEFVADPEKEREAWRQHFYTISQGRGRVNPEVWASIPKVRPMQKWMGEPPTKQEMDKCVGKMSMGRAGGEDGVLAEFIRYGGEKLRTQVYGVVKEMWLKATTAEVGQEANDWPVEWKKATQIPLWKQKGSKQYKNTWRCVTLLSVGTKLFARVVADRTQRWMDPMLREDQNGFRTARGTDDTHQISRSIIKEIVTSQQGDPIILSFYDIEKAYPKMCRDALWKLMDTWGADPRFVVACRALHEHTEVIVRVYEGTSMPYSMEKGHREGCPSSPPLFNCYHTAVMMDFETRRKRKAEETGLSPGIPWVTKVDGKLTRLLREPTMPGFVQEIKKDVMGSVCFADDTCTMALIDEADQADETLEKTM